MFLTFYIYLFVHKTFERKFVRKRPHVFYPLISLSLPGQILQNPDFVAQLRDDHKSTLDFTSYSNDF